MIGKTHHSFKTLTFWSLYTSSVLRIKSPTSHLKKKENAELSSSFEHEQDQISYSINFIQNILRKNRFLKYAFECGNLLNRTETLPFNLQKTTWDISIRIKFPALKLVPGVNIADKVQRIKVDLNSCLHKWFFSFKVVLF